MTGRKCGIQYKLIELEPGMLWRLLALDMSRAEGDRCVGQFEWGMPSNTAQRAFDIATGWLRVMPEHQRKGIATQLFTRYLAWLGGRSAYAEYSDAGSAFVRSYFARNPDALACARLMLPNAMRIRRKA